MTQVDCDVVVVGAGMSGLTAARALTQAGKRVLVLEARDRVGGRVLSKTLSNGVVVDLGGQWVAPTQHRVLNLASELGLGLFKTYEAGSSLTLRDGVTSRYEGIVSSTDANAAKDIEQGMEMLQVLSASVPLESPWTLPEATELDRLTFAGWIDKNLKTEAGRWTFKLLASNVFSVDASELSALHVAFYFGAAGGPNMLTSTSGGGQDSRFKEGMQSLATGLANDLQSTLRLSQPVESIHQNAQAVIVQSASLTIRAKRAIVALAPTLAGRIRYSPPMPPLRDLLTQRMPMGTALKMMFVYDKPFWRSEGLSGLAFTDQDVPQLVFDNSPDDGSCGILLGFTEGVPARTWMQATPEARRAAGVQTLVQTFGEKALNLVDYVEYSWAAEEFSRGCYAGTMPPGAWTSFGKALKAPVDRIHWAGTETATVWNGYVEGAMQAGERAAAEALEALVAEDLAHG